MKYSVPSTLLFVFLMGCSSSDTKNQDTASTEDTGNIQTEDTAENTTEPPEDTTDTEEPELAEYCADNNPELCNCDPERTYDPWMTQGGEVNYWIRDKKTESYPFTVEYDEAVWYGYLQMTSPEVARDKYTEDIFHAWFSETPNGPVLDGNEDCERYAIRAEIDFFWHQQEDDPALDGACFIGKQERVLYLNYETRCVPDYYEGLCDDQNKHKSDKTFQFDVARRLKTR